MTVVGFGEEPWSVLWKRQQSMMYHLSLRPEIDRVIVMNAGVWFTSLLLGRGRSRFGLVPLTWEAVATQRIGEKLRVVTPIHWIPFSRSSRIFSRLDVVEISARMRRSIGADNYVAVVGNIDSEMEPIINRIIKDASAVVFDWSDDFVEFFREAGKRAEVNRLCEKYIQRADLVLAVNESLAARALVLNPNSHVLTNATNFPVIDQLPQGTEPRRPLDWPKTQRPVVGYMGWINEQRIDLDILDALTQRLVDWLFVFIGPLMFRPENHRAREIFARPNVHCIPPVPYLELPVYLERFDVCILPFLINDHTKGNDPIKIYDYFAFGKPVVATRTAGIERVEKMIRIAADPDDFVRMVEQATKEDQAQRDSRKSIAAENGWPVRIEALIRLLQETGICVV
ncbi:MAG: glycosyltransferase [Nitrospirae bacterium]|nr:glycosyltransferase [Nitrospirota bacterium]